MPDDYRALVTQLALDEAAFVQLIFKGKIAGDLPWRMVTVRPVEIKNRYHLQFSHFNAKQDVTKNYAGADAETHLSDMLALPFTTIQARTTTEDVTIQITKKGKAIVHRRPLDAARMQEFNHDAAKDVPIPADEPDPFLQAVGIMNAAGQIKADMRGKFAQINEFLKLLEHTNALDQFDHTPLRILDCGCGSSYLTFAVYHYLNHIRQLPAQLVGVDVNPTVVAKSAAHSEQLGLGSDVCFYQSPIIQYQPDAPPDIILALHACDTATDEALAQGIQCGAGLILAVPCCHHDMHQQLESVDLFQPIMRHGILKKRMADILTDSFRALILRIMGYKTDVIEFVSSEHTDRNLMIRAVNRTPPGERAFVEEYLSLKSYWGVTPYLEKLLGDSFTTLIGG
jgi:SAM-dependent methyltransferase